VRLEAGAVGPSCRVTAGRPNPFGMPLGQIRRIASVAPPKDEDDVDETKRNILKLLAVAGLVGAGAGGLAGGALQYVQPPAVGISAYPKVQLIDADGSPLTVAKVESEYSIETNQDVFFYYPLLNEPNFLLNLYPASGTPNSGQTNGAENVPYGIGTHNSIVAYSGICQHLGCPIPAISFYPPGTCPQTPGGRTFYIHCSCHGSTYDVTNKAANLTGPAVIPLPQVLLETDSAGNIYATGMTPGSAPVNGHIDTLQGDYGVGTTSQLTKQTPIILCNIA
jgi:Rieske Fe-S protein